MRTNIIVFGGSFDPPHSYHIKLLKAAIKRIRPEKIIIIPTYLSPFKSRHTADYEHRKKMISLMLIKHHINFEINDFEYKKRRRVYTYEIARYMAKRYKNSDLYFLMGSDSFKEFERWKRYRDILKYFHIVVGIRKGYPIKRKYNAIILKEKFDNISSTDLRMKMFTTDYSGLDSYVKKYITDNGLYYSDIINRVKNIVTRERFDHILSTVKLAIKLAKQYEVDITKAFLSALLHDSAKDMSIKKQLSLIEKAGIKIKDIEKIKAMAPNIIHQWASAAVAKKIFNIKDTEILSAISKHTTGDKKMSLLDKIIYVSDFASEKRSFKEAVEIREIAFKDIENAFVKTRDYKREFVKKNGGFLYE
ncbi:MAG: nicotinate (nicotinamide) nucleotide adenylyltransferase [Elusimicrobiales bacterium]|jgi:nicotinate-nucleotide adenylyltransferase|nr:nicotinate (nicotinamide) nucleotide adenylyltransferase [Elusimicrobiales bacterium]